MQAFDLIELNGEDLRDQPMQDRKAKLARLLRGCDGIRFTEHLEEDGARVFEHACRLEFEGIVSKRRASWYRSGRYRTWIKTRNPDSPAARRIEEGMAPA